ncbi:MAG: AarF/ABC1/UbiB kinase family protein [Gammaproteobacteria bacterium]|nr:AarF/ABC1/UbiB kinase family protein [Gammaproteobacteria bacterium]MDH3481709.1 AarF/ABC1/UbiB kinase family protein [Gammaproteobacteria bacterium]
MSREDLITSAFGRFVRVGGLVGRVGVSMLSEQAVGLLREGPAKQLKKAENMVRNAARIADTLGEMKGAAMKVGQMLSLHEGLLPPEVSAVLSVLQKKAPSVSFDVMECELRSELDDFDALFESLEPEAFAAASIGQVHRGVLRDGREVAVKIQYPNADRMVKADLKNLKALLGNLVSLFTDIDFEPIWEEVRERLLEELDYLKEADNIRRTAAMQTACAEIIVPNVVKEATSRRVLTMDFVDGIPPSEATSDLYPQQLRDEWGVTLFEFTLRGLLEHRFLHADPNFANFAFREDGKVVVYDYGCMKEIPVDIAAGYSRLMDAVISKRKAAIPDILREMGVFKEGGAPLPRKMTDPYVDLMQDIVRASPPYTFGEDSSIYEAVYELGMANWQSATDVRFPRDMVFIDRTLAGLFGNLGKLRATGPWRRLVRKYTAITEAP